MTGSEHNDEFIMDEHDRIRTRTNRSGGIQVHSAIFICVYLIEMDRQFHFFFKFSYVFHVFYREAYQMEKLSI